MARSSRSAPDCSANSQKVVVRDADGRLTALSGYTQGRSEIFDAAGGVIFAGRYCDTRTYQVLAGDDALTPTGIRICDHWINGFGRGRYVGHAFSLGVHLTQEHEPVFSWRSPRPNRLAKSN
jgi:hypothetical protein